MSSSRSHLSGRKKTSSSAPSLGMAAGREAVQREKLATRQAPRRQPERHTVPASLRQQILRLDGYRCRWCGKSAAGGAELEIDHIVPVSRGGTNDPANLQTLCRPCNQAKSNQLIF